MNKKEVARILEEIGQILELKGENPFKVRSYYNAARVIMNLDENLNDLVEEDRLQDIKGIGDALSQKIKELVETGKSGYYEKLKCSIPKGLMEMLTIPSLGPRKIKILYDKLNITNIGELEYFCKENRLIALEGFGVKSQRKILEGIQFKKKYEKRHLLPAAEGDAHYIISELENLDGVIRIKLAGSLRRRLETIKDIDVIIAAESGKESLIMEKYCGLKRVEKVVAHGETKSSIVLDSGIASDLRVVSRQEYPYALHYFTGSKAHNIEMRKVAKEFQYKLNEYGLFKGEENIPCNDEEELYNSLGLQFIPPELREAIGEIEAARENNLPSLVELKDIRGVFHIHSNYSDGINSLEEIIIRCQELGYEYVSVCDHSKSANYANGLSEARVLQQHQEIEGLQEKYPGIRILKGIEADILPDGCLDYNDSLLAKFEIVIGSIHSRLKMTEEEALERIVKAMKNPYLTMIGHPTGRLLLAREPYPLDINKFIEAAAKYGKMIELNANPHRLDLDWRGCKYARECGVLVSINPDAHSLEGLSDTRYGVEIARKGWLTPRDIMNTRTKSELMTLLNLE
ncbi:DNA polymerase/3'-5' exonuclease PolX [bacterium]|nr:DNA polymerase/3'-5' exonuclease PolX [bacterium]